MPDRMYWADIFTAATWKRFVETGAGVSGFRDGQWNTVRQIGVGDFLLCYIRGISRFVGLLEVISKPYQDREPIWDEDVFPCRVRVKPVALLTVETGVPIHLLKGRLKLFEKSNDPRGLGNYVRRSPTKWDSSDGQVVAEAVREAERKPVIRAVDPAKLSELPPVLRAKNLGAVTVPENTQPAPETQTEATDETPHLEIQWLLSKLGSDMGQDVWVARNDRGKQWQAKRFTDLPRLKSELPLQFDAATNRTIELIDVLWLKGNAIVAAFEIESTTSIYSGLLRMSDLISMQPNLNIPLYVVAPDDRRSKVLTEVNRPTFSSLSPPLSDICRFIPFSALRERIAQLGQITRYLRTDFLDDIAEACEIDEV